MSSEDHPDWWKPVGGQNSQDSILERRSLVWNDNGVEAPDAPPAFYTNEKYKGKFFTRGCRGMIESIQVYCNGDGVDEMEIRYAPHPCLGPFNDVTIVPAAGWAWQDFPIEEMWDYDSLFIWVRECTANIDWGYDAVQPHDGHEGDSTLATWADMDIRPYFRVVYTGETPGDVPVSGIVNTIPIPASSSRSFEEDKAVPANTETLVVAFGGAGYCDYIEARVAAAVNSHLTFIRVYCDGVMVMEEQYDELNTYGHTTATPTVSLPSFGDDVLCYMLIHKRFEFRRRIQVRALNVPNPQTVTVTMHPTFIR